MRRSLARQSFPSNAPSCDNSSFTIPCAREAIENLRPNPDGFPQARFLPSGATSVRCAVFWLRGRVRIFRLAAQDLHRLWAPPHLNDSFTGKSRFGKEFPWGWKPDSSVKPSSVCV